MQLQSPRTACEILGYVQATFQGVLSAGLFFCVSNSKPREILSKARPHMTVFCKYAMCSLIGQFCLQIGFIIYMFLRARHLMPKVRRASHKSCPSPGSYHTGSNY